MIVSTVGGLFGTALFVNLGGATGDLLRLSVLPRNVTTAIGIAICQILGGNISISDPVIVLTGILGATFGAALMYAAGIRDPVSRGLGQEGGCSGSGSGGAHRGEGQLPIRCG